jgi:uncharacterized protein (UPF0262 family)
MFAIGRRLPHPSRVMDERRDNHRLQKVEIDDESLAATSRDQEQERQIAIFDLIEDNYFAPDGAEAGPYELRMSVLENRLVLDITGPDYQRRHILSLSPLRGRIRDYLLICDSYYQAIRSSTPSQIEALDMGRRGLHDEAAEVLRARLAGKIETDRDTARRLFTLLCALHWRG